MYLMYYVFEFFIYTMKTGFCVRKWENVRQYTQLGHTQQLSKGILANIGGFETGSWAFVSIVVLNKCQKTLYGTSWMRRNLIAAVVLPFWCVPARKKPCLSATCYVAWIHKWLQSDYSGTTKLNCGCCRPALWCRLTYKWPYFLYQRKLKTMYKHVSLITAIKWIWQQTTGYSVHTSRCGTHSVDGTWICEWQR